MPDWINPGPQKPEPATDLEWMLCSNRVSDEVLAETLLRYYYTDIARLCVELTGEVEQIPAIACQTIAQAVLQRHVYRGTTAVKTWLLGLAEAQSMHQGKPLIKVDHETIPAQVIEPAAQEAAAQLADLRIPDLTDQEYNEYLASIKQQIQREKKGRLFAERGKEMILAGVILAVIFLLGRLSNSIWPENELAEPTPASQIQSLLSPETMQEEWQETPVPFTPVPPADSLNMDSSSDEIEAKLVNSLKYWHTLWADILIIQYGPPSYTGSPQSMIRKQVWIAQPLHTRVVYGTAGGEPEGTYSIIGKRMYWKVFQFYEYLSEEKVTDYDLQKLFLTEPFILQEGSFRITGLETIANRQALVLDWLNQNGVRNYRYWVDTEYGVVLHRRQYWGTNPDSVVEDMLVTSISFDKEFSAAIFNPFDYRGVRFAQDYSGVPEGPGSNPIPSSGLALTGHEPKEQIPPPAGFNPFSSFLTFQWPSLSTEESVPAQGIDLFADNYFLGTIPLPNTSILTCERSSNGQYVAFNTVTALAASNPIVLYWLDLAKAPAINKVLPNGNVTADFEFSPDDLRLAFFGCGNSMDNCGIYILDLETSNYSKLLSAKNADYFLWKPDGEYLAAAVSMDRSSDWRYLIIRTMDGKITYEGKFDWSQLEPDSEAPSNSWEGRHQIKIGGLEGCANPPQSIFPSK